MKGKKTGGRKKGTPNTKTVVGMERMATIKDTLAQLITGYYQSEQIAEDLAALEPKDRVAAMERFTKYIIPTMQSASIDIDGAEKKQSVEERLILLSKTS